MSDTFDERLLSLIQALVRCWSVEAHAAYAIITSERHRLVSANNIDAVRQALAAIDEPPADELAQARYAATKQIRRTARDLVDYALLVAPHARDTPEVEQPASVAEYRWQAFDAAMRAYIAAAQAEQQRYSIC